MLQCLDDVLLGLRWKAEFDFLLVGADVDAVEDFHRGLELFVAKIKLNFSFENIFLLGEISPEIIDDFCVRRLHEFVKLDTFGSMPFLQVLKVAPIFVECRHFD